MSFPHRNTGDAGIYAALAKAIFSCELCEKLQFTNEDSLLNFPNDTTFCSPYPV